MHAAVAGSEWTWGTLKNAVARGESRSRYTLLSFAAIAVVIAVGLVVAFVIGVAAALLGASLAGVSTSGLNDSATLGRLPEQFVRGWLAIIEEGALGFAIATLARSQLAGIVPASAKRVRLGRVTHDQESWVVHRFDQARDKWVEKPRAIVALIRATEPAPDAARPRVLADAGALRARAVQGHEHPGPVQVPRQAFGERRQGGMAAVIRDGHRVARHQAAVRDHVGDALRL